MTRTLTIIALAAAATLAGCDNSDHNIVAGDGYDPQENALQNLDQVELPPSIAASHSYRCQDNSVIYIDWLNNDSARIKQERSEVGTTVTREGEEGPYTAEGQSLEGSADAQSVTVNGQTCRR